MVDRIAAVVNDELILWSELNEALLSYIRQIEASGHPPERRQEMLAQVRRDVLEGMIDQKLTDQEIRRLEIVVSEADIDSAIESVKRANNATDAQLEAMLAKQGLTLDSYRLKMKERILRSRLVDLQVKSKIVITARDIEAYYRKHPERFGGQTQYRLSNLMVRTTPEQSREIHQAARETMEAIHRELSAGRPYDASGATGMDLGWIDFNRLSPQLQEALDGLAPGAFTAVLATDQGYQIFFVQDVRGSQGKPLEQVSGEIEKELYQEVIDAKFKSWVEDLRARSLVKIID